jgi:hypothetical protein
MYVNDNTFFIFLFIAESFDNISAGMPSPATALFTRAMGRKRPRTSSSGA